MLLALGADLHVLLQILFPDDLAAAVAFDPQAFRADGLLARKIQLAGLSFKPSHNGIGNLVIEQFSNLKPLSV
jgi:hypothetical protein